MRTNAYHMFVDGVDFFSLLSEAAAQALGGRDARVFEARFGLITGEPLTLAEIGELEGVTRERIRQLINRCMRKLRYRSSSKSDPVVYAACLELHASVREALRPSTAGLSLRAVDFADEMLTFLPTKTHALPLLAGLLGKRGLPDGWLNEAKLLLNVRRKEERIKARLEQSDERFRKRCAKLFAFIHWEGARVLSESDYGHLTRTRDTSGERSGTYFSKKLNRKVQFESGIEHHFFQRLERHPDVPFYQEQPFAIPYEFDGLTRTYYPDIFFVLKDKGVVVEIKPRSGMGLYQNLCKWTAMRAFCEERGFGLLVTDSSRTIQEVQSLATDPQFEAALLLRLQRGPLAWRELRMIRDDYGVKVTEFVATVLRHRLEWRLKPLELRLGSKTVLQNGASKST